MKKRGGILTPKVGGILVVMEYQINSYLRKIFFEFQTSWGCIIRFDFAPLFD